jgi:hypothetical protein
VVPVVNALDRRMDATDRGPMPSSRSRPRVPCRKHPCDPMDVPAIRKRPPTPASTSRFIFCFDCFGKFFLFVISLFCFFLCSLFSVFEGLLWTRTRTLPAFLATSLVVRACRKNGTPRWTPRTRTLIKGIRNSGR